MDAIKLLKAQHREVEKLLEKLVHLGPRAAKSRKKLFEQVADLLATHSALEERVFYHSVNVSATEELLLESLEMHLAIKRVLADLLTCDEQDPTYKAKTIVLRELVVHHLHEEEKTIFPTVQRRFSAEKLKDLGREMQDMLADLETRSPRQEVPAQTDRAAPLETAEYFTGVIPEYRD
jgi:hemerythrin superfamily protein